MKLRALEDITDHQGSIKGFGFKAKGEVFEIEDQNRAKSIIDLGGAEEVVETTQAQEVIEAKTKAKS